MEKGKEEAVAARLNEWKRRPDLYKVLLPLARVGLDARNHRTIQGAENIPEGPVFYVANHIKAIESPQLAVTISELTKRAVRLAVKSGYMEGKGIDDHGQLGRTAKFVMEWTHQVPVNREQMGSEDYWTTQAIMNYIFGHGDSFAIHPEATRGDGLHVNKFHPSFIRMGVELGATFEPVGIRHYPHKDGKPETIFSFGEPLTPEIYNGPLYPMTHLAPRAQAVTNELEERVANLADLPRSHKFAELKKGAKPAPQE